MDKYRAQYCTRMKKKKKKDKEQLERRYCRRNFDFDKLLNHNVLLSSETSNCTRAFFFFFFLNIDELSRTIYYDIIL